MKKLIGKWGEDVTSFWLQNQEYEILHSRWHCRYAEIDIIAKNIPTSTLCFIEVKTRSIKNWDENGILAINTLKQEKLKLAGQIFLGQYSAFSVWNCRFDVALLTYQKILSSKLNPEEMNFVSTNQNIISYQGYRFEIVNYLENAFA